MAYGIRRSLLSAGDPDAQAYILRAGVTDPVAKAAINSFVKGIKGMGLWNSLVCWPLISTQNAGTGTTAYSLGGLGAYNGTLTNGPLWTTTGISMSGGSEYIGWSKTGVFASAMTQIASFVILNGTQSIDGMGHQDGGQAFNGYVPASTQIQGRLKTSAALYNQDKVGLTGVIGQLRSWISNSFSNHAITSSGLIQDGSPVSTSGTLTLVPSTFYIGRDSIYGSTAIGKIPFYSVFSQGLTFSTSQALYSLYKATLGASLGLP